MRQQQNIAAIYCRISRDDGGDAESNSIGNQRSQLREYAKQNGFIVHDEYIDDGISGTTFERTDFKRMIADIDDGKISVVLCKDLSRLGRNNALVAYYTELFFPDNDVRFICVNDGIDTFKGENEIMGFKSIINEYYARDISKKIRSSNRTMAKQGKFLGAQVAYGYKRDENDYHKLVVDEEVAGTVKRMFDLAASGVTAIQIARTLSREKVLTPRAYMSKRTGKFKTAYNVDFPYDWGKTTVISILKNQVYLGHLVSHKKTTKSFKNKKLIDRPESEWIIVKNTHTPLVAERTFESVQDLLSVKRRVHTTGKENIFVGMLRCSTCGVNLGFAGTQSKQGAFICNRYRKYITHCTSHYISYKSLYALVLEDVQVQAAIAKAHEHDLDEYVRKLFSGRAQRESASLAKELDKAKARCSELDNIIKRLFEQNVSGVVSDERFMILSGEYEAEQKTLTHRISKLTEGLSQQKSDHDVAVAFHAIIKKYTDVSELSVPILNELISHIVVHSAVGRYKERTQKIDIYYRFVGLTPGK